MKTLDEYKKILTNLFPLVMVHRVKKACLLPPLPQQPKLCLGTEHGVFEGPHGLNQVKLLYYTALVCNGMAQAVRHYMVMAYTIM